jgi:hypothetical protein
MLLFYFFSYSYGFSENAPFEWLLVSIIKILSNSNIIFLKKDWGEFEGIKLFTNKKYLYFIKNSPLNEMFDNQTIINAIYQLTTAIIEI